MSQHSFGRRYQRYLFLVKRYTVRPARSVTTAVIAPPPPAPHTNCDVKGHVFTTFMGKQKKKNNPARLCRISGTCKVHIRVIQPKVTQPARSHCHCFSVLSGFMFFFPRF